MRFIVTSIESRSERVVDPAVYPGPVGGARWVRVNAESTDGDTITYGTSDHPQVGDVLEVTVKPAEREAE